MFLGIIIFVLILGLLVFVHEFGHFWAARLSGVKVEEFAFGFPPRLFSWKRGETRYAINLFPIGGYVKLLGEEQNIQEKGSFHAKPVWVRLLIVASGVVMNFILAIVILTIGFSIGMTPIASDPATLKGKHKPQVVVVYVKPGSPAEQAGIKPGTIIKRFENTEQLRRVTKRLAGYNLRLPIVQDGQSKTIAVLLSKDKDAPLGVGTVSATVVKQTLPQAFLTSFKETGLIIKTIFVFLGDIFQSLFTTGKPGPAAEGVIGPVGLFNFTVEAVKVGWIYVLQLVALLTINLGLINILPFPALDGGKVLFLALEGMFRRKIIRQEIENIIHLIGFFLMIALLIAITYRDIIKLR